MLLGLAACTSGGSGAPTIVGAWEGSVDMGEALAAGMQMDIEEKISCKVTFTFKEDGTYTVAMDQESLKNAMDTLMDVVVDVLLDAYKDQGIDLEAELKKEGMTMDDFIEMMMGSIDLEDMMGETDETGYYKYENGKIYTAEDKDDLNEGDYDDVYIVTLLGKTLTITDIETDGESAAEQIPDIFPMVFTKQ